MFTFRTGVSWRDLPERFGLWQTVRGRCARWVADGAFGRLGRSPERGGGGLAVAVDSTVVRAHQHTAVKGG
ncbi:transposase [Streptomyces sp. NPDC015127]|uniref:transposase n=1 Tax=Streptomyces sp. NPDC015127 TaxID=3364939 RepID=UPI0036F5C6C4